MTSQKQTEANRRNAEKSTGPTSIEGKAKVRFNAKRDGITGQVTTMTDEDRPVFEKLKAELIAELSPRTTLELKLANAIAWDTWRLDLIRAVEMNTYAYGLEDPEVAVACDDPEIRNSLVTARTFGKESERFLRMSLYAQRMSRTLERNLATLRSLQAERKRNRAADREQEVQLANACYLRNFPYEASTEPGENGFVFSTDEILATLFRERTSKLAYKATLQTRDDAEFTGVGANPDQNQPHSGLKVSKAA